MAKTAFNTVSSLSYVNHKVTMCINMGQKNSEKDGAARPEKIV
jgi:hypothetical protein